MAADPRSAVAAPDSGAGREGSARLWLPATLVRLPLARRRLRDARRARGPEPLRHRPCRLLAALYTVDPTRGPAPGAHSAFRGAPLATYDDDARSAISALEGEIDTAAASQAWESALAAPWHGPPVWVHGDVTATNLLVLDGRLAGVLDFGCMAVGDPACDLAIAWTLFHGDSRQAFRDRLAIDDETWARGRCWALWKALITLAQALRTGSADPDRAAIRFGWRVSPREVIDEVLGGFEGND